MSSDLTNNQQDATQGIFDDILKVYGLKTPQVSILVAVIFGSLGFNEYFNPGAWTFISLLSFALVYLFRRQISHRLLKVSLFVLLILIIFFCIPIIFFYIQNINVLEWIKKHPIPASTYLAASITIPLAIIMISYKKQEERMGLSLPPKLNDAINQRLMRGPFIKENVLYDVKISAHNEDGVMLNITYSCIVVNRTKEKQIWTSRAASIESKMKMTGLKIGQNPINIQDVDYLTPHGVEIPHEIPPLSKEAFEYHMNVEGRSSGTEMLTTFTCATDMRIRVTNLASHIGIRFVCHHERSKTIHPIINDEGNLYTLTIDDGLLPYQGALLKWYPKSNKSG